MATVSQVRQNYAEDSEKGVNKQINMELYAMYTYLSMVSSRTKRASASYRKLITIFFYTYSRTTLTGTT